jgi:hypothetical protein
MPNKNVQKRKARPKRSIEKPGEDHELGLWIDYDLLRKHQNRTATIIHDGSSLVESRYLRLADLALAPSKPKKRTKAAGPNSGIRL